MKCLLDFMSNLRQRILNVSEMARKNQRHSYNRMKTWYDKKAKRRQFKLADKVLPLLPVPTQPLQA